MSYLTFRLLTNNFKQFVRHKHKESHWSVQRKKIFAIHKALDHFDDFYSKVFDKSWNSIRHGLLRKQKYIAVVNNYSDSERVITELENCGGLNVRTLFNLQKDYIREEIARKKEKQHLAKIHRLDRVLDKREKDSQCENPVSINDNSSVESDDSEVGRYSLEKSLSEAEIDTTRLVDPANAFSTEILHQYIPATAIKGREDWIPESDHYRYYDVSDDFNIKIEKEYDLHFPQHLNVFCYEPENFSNFPSSKLGATGVLDYYLMDGGSLLPVLALDLKPGQKVLDMCAAPGGKSLLALQTLYPDCLVCNDVTFSRVDRVFNVFKQYLYDLNERWLQTGRLRVTCLDGRRIVEDDFDRIIVDVPCTTDRHSVKENDNNIFKAARIKERLKLPELQTELLLNALKLVKPGGIVVYSTCSLSPIQNDGVVNMTLKKLWEETKIEVVVRDLTKPLREVTGVYKLADQRLLKYGHLVVPYAPQNFGPTYFCKLERIK